MNPSDSRYGLRRFRFLIRFSRWSPHHRNGSPVLHGISSTTCHPCYPGSRWTPLPLFQRPSSGLPLQDTGSASPFSVTRLRLGSLALRPAALPWETYDLRLLERRFPVLERRTDNSFHGTLTRWIYRRSRRPPRPLSLSRTSTGLRCAKASRRGRCGGCCRPGDGPRCSDDPAGPHISRNGLVIRTAPITAPCCMSSVNNAEQPLAMAACRTSAS